MKLPPFMDPLVQKRGALQPLRASKEAVARLGEAKGVAEARRGVDAARLGDVTRDSARRFVLLVSSADNGALGVPCAAKPRHDRDDARWNASETSSGLHRVSCSRSDLSACASNVHVNYTHVSKT